MCSVVYLTLNFLKGRGYDFVYVKFSTGTFENFKYIYNIRRCNKLNIF
ncbi:hypothetical protein VCR14J2_270196 [Vibrio coralliirubri]|nr:hypothetical protein VCR14J2_270196 [Vibrio coralliirubri]